MNQNEPMIRDEERHTSWPKPFAAGMLIMALLGVGAVFLLERLDVISFDTDQTTTASEETQTTDNTVTPAGPEADTLISSDNPNLKLTLKDFQVEASGTVSSQESLDRIDTALTKDYGTFATNNVKINPTAEAQAWEESTLTIVGNLQILIEGEIEIADGGNAKISGEAPQDVFLDYLQGVVLVPENGVTITENNVNIIEQNSPSFEIVSEEGAITVSGTLETEEIKTAIFEDLQAIYGAENITDNVEIDPTVFTRFAFILIGRTAGVLEPFGDYTAGVENDLVYATIKDGFSFESGSFETSDELTANIENLAFFLDQSIHPIRLTGYTDSSGSAEQNIELSKQRAQIVADAIIETDGIEDPSRLVVEGKGAENFVAPNDTPENRAKNRRVELVMTVGDEL